MTEYTDDAEVFIYTEAELAEIQTRYDTAIRALYDTTTPSPEDVAHIPTHTLSTAAQLCSDAALLAESLAADEPAAAVERILCHNDLAGLVMALGLMVNEAADARNWHQLQEQVWQAPLQPVIPSRLATLGWASHRPDRDLTDAVEAPPEDDHIDPYDAVEAIAKCRHHLPSDILRSLGDIWFCASAARFGQPYEPFWKEQDAAAYAAHNTAECEDENDHPEWGPGHLMGQFHDETGLLNFYRGDPDLIDDTEDVEPFLAWIAEQPQGRTAAWDLIRRRYGRSDRELIAGVVKQHAPLS